MTHPQEQWMEELKKAKKKFMTYFDGCDPYDIGNSDEQAWGFIESFITTQIEAARREERLKFNTELLSLLVEHQDKTVPELIELMSQPATKLTNHN